MQKNTVYEQNSKRNVEIDQGILVLLKRLMRVLVWVLRKDFVK